MEFILLLILGVAVGFISSFFGVGGGIVMVPLLNLFFPELDQKYIIATSLSVIFINSMVNTYNFKKSVQLHWNTVFTIAFSSVIFAFITANYAQVISSVVLKWIFVVFLLITISLLLKKREENLDDKAESQLKKVMFKILIGVIAGFISAITGMGGGAIIVPLMLYWLHTEMKSVSAYSNAVMIFTTCSGMLSYLLTKAPEVSMPSVGYVLPFVALFIILGSCFGCIFLAEVLEQAV